MGGSRDNEVLKLVYPGRHVEIHTQPITAAEVMKRNPRHCVARPDFFKFPWIVVRPESLLLPGRAFYIVPHCTIYQLLKDSGRWNQQQPLQHRFPDDNHRRGDDRDRDPRLQATTSSLNSLAGRTPMYQLYGQRIRINPPLPRRGCPNSQDEDSDQISVNDRNRMLHTYRPHHRQDYDNSSASYSSTRIGTVYDREHQNNGVLALSRTMITNDDQRSRGNRRDVRLRPCLRKPDSVRRSHSLRVTFARSPTESQHLEQNV